MKYLYRISGICISALLLALAGGMTSCSVMENGDDCPDNLSTEMAVKPHVFRGTVTKAVGDQVPGIDAQKENDLLTLDVFFAGADEAVEGGAAGNKDFWKSYHLTATEDGLQAAIENLL